MVSSQLRRGSVTIWWIPNFGWNTFNCSLENHCKISIPRVCGDLTQIKDHDLEKGKKKTWMVFPELTYCVCISVQCLPVFNAHTQLEEGSTHSVFCSVWVWIKGKHVVPFCFLWHSVKWREKPNWYWYCHHRGCSCHWLGLGSGSPRSICRQDGISRLGEYTGNSAVYLPGRVNFHLILVFVFFFFFFFFFCVSTIWMPLAICCLWNTDGCSEGILHDYKIKQ